MVRLEAPNGAVVEARDEDVKALEAAGFKRATARKTTRGRTAAKPKEA